MQRRYPDRAASDPLFLQIPSMIASRLPHVGTTIFTVMSALATRHDAVNLGQGFPDFECDPALIEAVTRAMKAGHNQYPPMSGWGPLRQAIATKIENLYERRYDPDTEITVTAGATQAVLTAMLALIHPGDEVIVIEPAYDCYEPAIHLAGAKAVFVSMELASDEADGFVVPWDRLRAAITDRTRMIVLNSPHNPTGMALTQVDMLALQSIVVDHGLYLLSDEVYEHMLFDGRRHESASRYPALAERSVVVSSFGKTFHVTGWKVGYVAAPAAISAEFRKVHQFNVFTVNTPMQAAIADYLTDPKPYLQLAEFYQAKRDFFRDGLKATRLKQLPSSGTYFLVADYSDVRTDLSESEFCQWLTREKGVAAIPLSAFYARPVEARLIRFCFAKKEQTLRRALDCLMRI
jgi:methionine aminotransferase